MVQSEYIEYTFLAFYDHVANTGMQMQSPDRSAAFSFYTLLLDGKELTQNQANFLLKILQKYRHISALSGLDYNAQLKNPKWKRPFRTIDMSKSLAVSQDSTGRLWIDMKFPYHLKAIVESTLLKKNIESNYDYDNKIRKIALYDANLIQIYEFCKSEAFIIDDSFLDALAQIEEIWQNQDDVLPYCKLTNNVVELVNAPVSAIEWWNSRAQGNNTTDLLLAKSMGFLLKSPPTTMFEKIANSPSNSFWLQDPVEFVNMCKDVPGKVCIVLDRPSKNFDWIREFSETAKLCNYDLTKIKVCYREDQNDTTGFNQWVRDQGHSGKIDEGNIFIFNHKPPKWLFKDPIDVTIIATNHLYPPTKNVTKDWISSHPCVIYLGDIKPSETRNQDIVNLHTSN